MIDQDNLARRIAVKTAARADGFVAIENGPPVGTRVALGGGAFLLDGDLVDPVAAKTVEAVAGTSAAGTPSTAKVTP